MNDLSADKVGTLARHGTHRLRLCRYFYRLIATIAACVASAVPAHAAEITGDSDEVVLEGNIEAGDYDKLRGFILKNEVYPGEIYLASPGGDLAEAMKIGRLLRELRWDTVVPAQPPGFIATRESLIAAHKLKHPDTNYMCASACFLVFIAGIHRTANIGDAILGIHRPYLPEDNLKGMSGDQAIASTNRVRATVDGYLKEMGVPVKYADLMFSVPKEEVRWINRADFDVDLEGFILELKDWINAKCDTRTDVEKAVARKLEKKNAARQKLTEEELSISKLLFTKQHVEQPKCERQVKFELRTEAWRKYTRSQRDPLLDDPDFSKWIGVPNSTSATAVKDKPPWWQFWK